MGLVTYPRNLPYILFKIFGLILFLAVFVTHPVSAQRTDGVNGGVEETCEVSPGTVITCPAGYTCQTISGVKRCLPAPTSSPTSVVAAPSPTRIPTPSPTRPPIQVTVVDNCRKSAGDANCDFSINLLDFEQWRREFTKEVTTKTADFDSDNFITISDFEIWRKTYFSESQITVTPTRPPSPTATAAPSFNLSTCTITASTGRQIIYGTEGADVICILSFQNQVSALGGNDTIYINNVSNYVETGLGNDTITVGPQAASNVILSQDGDDTIDTLQSQGSMSVDGGAGTDTCRVKSTDSKVNCEI